MKKIKKELQGSDTINNCCIHSSVWDWQQLFTGERLEMFYLFSRLKHLHEYIYVYEWTAEVTTAFRTLERQNKKWRHNTGKFYHSWQSIFK